MRPAPYPADTRAKGWRFELDYEKIEQSDTWDIAAEVPMAQHALVMMWLMAWRQEPCGAFPNDPELIRVKCKVPRNNWEALQPILMRGWWLADDGRLYHDTVTARVLEMIEYRRKEAARRAGNRGKTQDHDSCPPVVPRDTSGTPHAILRQPPGSPDTGTGTSSSPTSKKKPPRKRVEPLLCPDDVAEQVWVDWLALRAKKKADVSGTVVEAARSEAAKAGVSLDAFLRLWCLRGTQGLQAEWLKPHERSQGPPAIETPYARQMRERAQTLAPGVASHAPASHNNVTLVEVDGKQKLIA